MSKSEFHRIEIMHPELVLKIREQIAQDIEYWARKLGNCECIVDGEYQYICLAHRSANIARGI